MRINLNKFGTILTSRQLGREAYSAFLPSLREIEPEEVVEVDFDGVAIFSPSWGDEFLTPLAESFKDKVVFLNTENSSVQATLSILDRTKKNLENSTQAD